MRERILKDIITAMKEKNKDKLNVLRMVKGSIQLEEINLKRELDDTEVGVIITKAIKTRNESKEGFIKAGRSELIEAIDKEIAILTEYLPEQLSDEELRKIIDEKFNELKPTSMADMGKLMGVINPIVKGKADMSYVSKIIKDKLNNL